MRSRMRPWFCATLATSFVGCAASRPDGASHGPAAAAPTKSSPAVQRLKADLDAVFDQPKYSSAFWGVRVERADGKVLYDRLGGKEFTPASNMKLFTTAAALELLGPDFTYETRLEAIGTIEADGTLTGDLLIVGSGDPSLGAWHPDKDRNSRQVLADWVARIKAAGIRTIAGDIVGDGRCFTDESYCEGWNYGDLHFWYAAPTSGLAIEENAFRVIIRPGPKAGDPATIDVIPKTGYITIINDTKTVAAGGPNTADSVPWDTQGNTRRFVGTIALDKKEIAERGSVWDGPRYAAQLLAEELDRQGIKVHGKPVNIRALPGAVRIDKADAARRKVLATTVSPPLKDLVRVVNKISHNFFADQIVRTLGRRKLGTGDFESGTKVVRAWLEDIGTAEAETFRMYDGSGLDRDDAVQPRQTCHVLRYMSTSALSGAAFVESLPIGSTDGTLRERLNDSNTRGNVRAKTGYIGHVRCLSGYVTDADGDDLVFSMMCNQYVIPTSEVNASQDAACGVLARFREKTGK